MKTHNLVIRHQASNYRKGPVYPLTRIEVFVSDPNDFFYMENGDRAKLFLGVRISGEGVNTQESSGMYNHKHIFPLSLTWELFERVLNKTGIGKKQRAHLEKCFRNFIYEQEWC